MRINIAVPLTLSQICSFTGAINLNYPSDALISAISTDTRELSRGDLFIALRGENYDGNDFANFARSRGAYVLSSRRDAETLLVKDTSEALLLLAMHYKSLLPRLKHTVAITGSAGKTTTKNFLLRILSPSCKAYGTDGNLNNLVGVPLTLLSLPYETEIAVFELGMNHMGEISRLSNCIRPSIAAITNIGSSHIGNLGSREMIAKAKLEISDGMQTPHIVTELEENLLSGICHRTTLSMRNPRADYCFLTVSEGISSSSFDFHTRHDAIQGLCVPFFGEHLFTSLAFALALSCECGLGEEELRLGVKNIDESCLRHKWQRIRDFVVFDDSYNAAPESVYAALEMLKKFKSHPRAALLGDILELGANTEKIHRSIGYAAYKSGIEHLYLFGVYAPFIAEGALAAGMSKGKIFINDDPLDHRTSARQILEHHLAREIILFKASHRMNLSKITEILKKED